MASKQLNKLRQWAGEVVSLRDKSTVTEEFKELEKDIELRKIGAERLLMASEGYYKALSKKKVNFAFNDSEKLLPVDTLGAVMIIHGEEFGDDSAFGSSLVKAGRAHCQVATLQEAFALTFKDTFIASIERLSEDIKEYEVLRKKLESRRLTHDAATNKFEKLKNSKKEKDRREAEDEMEKAKQRYEETSEDVRAHMELIQEHEVTQMRDLTAFIDHEISFVQHHLEVLQAVKTDWKAGSHEPRRELSNRTLSKQSKEPKTNSLRSRKGSQSSIKARAAAQAVDSSDEEEDTPSTQRMSLHQRKDSAGSRPSSRPASRLSRKRADSSGGGVSAAEEKEPAERSRRLSMAGWASSAVESMRKKNRDVDLFTEIDGDDDHRGGSPASTAESPTLTKRALNRLGTSSRKKSKENLPAGSLGASPKVPPRILKPPSLQERKVVRALHDFNGSSDELTFRAGNEIVVVNEVLDGWWLGELGGRTGLFPTTYVEVVSSSSSSGKPPIPQRPGSSKPSNITNTRPVEDDDTYGITSDDDEAHALAASPLTHHRSPFYGGFGDTASITSGPEEEDEPDSHRFLVPPPRQPQPFTDTDDDDTYSFSSSSLAHVNSSPPKRTLREPTASSDLAEQPLLARRTTTPTAEVNTTPMKKVPPPPPPRRISSNALTATPPVPDRRVNGGGSISRAHSSPASSFPQAVSASSYLPTPAPSVAGSGYDTSPFESALDVTSEAAGMDAGACKAFRQNPFKPQGMCSNCFQYHG